jgi:MSHA pilin protein MshC
MRAGGCRVEAVEESQLRSKGFTLIELIVVMLVLGILAAVFIPRSNNPAIIVSTQAEQLAADIRYVQSLAMTQGRRYRINFITATSYNFTDISGSSASSPHPSGLPFPILLATGVTLSPQAPLLTTFSSPIAFDGLGIPYTDQSATAKLAAMATISVSGSGSTRTIQIYPETGMVRVP